MTNQLGTEVFLLDKENANICTHKRTLVLERTDKEIIIRLPNATEWGDLETILKYICYREIVSKSQATQDEIDQIASEMNKSWWDANKHRFLKDADYR